MVPEMIAPPMSSPTVPSHPPAAAGRRRRFIATTGRWANVAGCLALVEVRDRETYASAANRAPANRSAAASG